MSDSAVVPATKEKHGFSVFWVISSIVLIILLTFSGLLNLVLGLMVAALGTSGIESNLSQKKVVQTLGESLNEKDEINSQILVINLKGVITGQDIWSQSSIIPEHIEKQLLQAKKDSKIKAVILKITSPGGEITASDKIYQAVLEFREKTKKPVLAYFDTLAASGGYYIAVATDEIIAHPTCITGSIGVIFSFFQFHELMKEKLGIQYTVIKSGPNKDAGSFARALTEEEKKIFQSMIDEMYERFLEVVTKGRPELAKLSREELVSIADGRIYTAKQALSFNLVDSVDYWNKALERAKVLANISEDEIVQVVTYQQTPSLFQELFGSKTQKPSLVQECSSIIEEYTRPNMYYLWLSK